MEGQELSFSGGGSKKVRIVFSFFGWDFLSPRNYKSFRYRKLSHRQYVLLHWWSGTLVTMLRPLKSVVRKYTNPRINFCLYSSELALHKRHVGSTEMTIWRYSLFSGLNFCSIGQQRLVKGLLFHMNYFLIICVHRSVASPGQYEQWQCAFNIGMYCNLTVLHSNSSCTFFTVYT